MKYILKQALISLDHAFMCHLLYTSTFLLLNVLMLLTSIFLLNFRNLVSLFLLVVGQIYITLVISCRVFEGI